MPTYSSSIVVLGSGQEVHLPGDAVFTMPHVIPSEIDIFDIDTAQRYPLGTKLVDGDNAYRYVEYGGTTKAGDLIQAEAPDAAHDALDPSGSLVAAGSKVITIVDTITLVLNEYAGGKLVTEVGTGLGYTYDILSHDAPASGAEITIKHGLAVAVVAATNVRLTKSRWKEVIIHPADTPTAICAGVGLAVGADGSFGWSCTKGPVGVYQDLTAAAPIGVGLIPGATAGEVALYDVSGTADIQPVGYQLRSALNDSEVGDILMTLDG